MLQSTAHLSPTPIPTIVTCSAREDAGGRLKTFARYAMEKRQAEKWSGDGASRCFSAEWLTFPIFFFGNKDPEPRYEEASHHIFGVFSLLLRPQLVRLQSCILRNVTNWCTKKKGWPISTDSGSYFVNGFVSWNYHCSLLLAWMNYQAMFPLAMHGRTATDVAEKMWELRSGNWWIFIMTELPTAQTKVRFAKDDNSPREMKCKRQFIKFILIHVGLYYNPPQPPCWHISDNSPRSVEVWIIPSWSFSLTSPHLWPSKRLGVCISLGEFECYVTNHRVCKGNYPAISGFTSFFLNVFWLDTNFSTCPFLWKW